VLPNGTSEHGRRGAMALKEVIAKLSWQFNKDHADMEP
jgi:hypothetical protein